MRSLRLAVTIGALASWTSLAQAELPPIPPELQPLHQKAREQFEQGNFVGAEATYRKLVTQAPNDVRSISNLGVTLFRLNKYEEAEEQFKKSLTVSPDDEFSYRLLGIVYYTQGRHVLARKSIEQAIRLDPKDSIAHNYLGINASQMGSNEEAADELKTAVGLDGAYSDAYFNLSIVLLLKPKPELENARGYYERSIKLGAEPDAALEQLLGVADGNGIRMVTKPLTPQDVERLRATLLARR